MVVWRCLLLVCVIVHVASPLEVTAVENTDTRLSYEEMRELLATELVTERQRADAERQRADAERQRADAERQRADSTQQKLDEENLRQSQILAKCHSFEEILPEADSRSNSLPDDAFVPHIRSLEKFPDLSGARCGDYPAITTPSSNEEREQAAAEIKKIQPKFRIADMRTDPQIEVTVQAYQDRGKTGDIVFSSDFVWAIERVKNREEALFVTITVIGHEKAHGVGHNNRYKDTDSTPENFRSMDEVCNIWHRYYLLSHTYFMLQGGGEAGDVFEKRLLGGRVELLCVSNRSFIDGEFSAVFYPANGPLANFPCLFKPSYFADFLKKPRMPVWNEDYFEIPRGSVLMYPAVISGNALGCELSTKQPNFPAQQADPSTPTKNGSRLRTGFYSSCLGVYRNQHRRNCIPRQVPQLQLAPSKQT